MKKRTNVVALMAVFSVGVCFIILGAVSIELMEKININERQFGSLVMALFLTSCIVQIFIGPMVDKFGHKPLAITGFAITGLSILLLAFASNFMMATMACVLLGIGAMSLNTVGNTLIPAVLFEGKDPARASNFGNIFFGLGYVLTPLIFTLLIKIMSYTAVISIIGLIFFIFLGFALTTRFPEVFSGFRISMVFSLLKKPMVLMALAALFLYMSLEITMATWSKPLMTELFGGGAQATAKAGLVLSMFGVSMMIGRFIASRIKNLTAIGAKVIVFGSMISLVTIILLIVTKNPVIAILSILITGLVFGPIFPNVVGVTFARFDPGFHGSIFGIIFAGGLLGGTFIPKYIGNLSAGDSSVQQNLVIAAVMAGILCLIAFLLGRLGNRNQSRNSE